MFLGKKEFENVGVVGMLDFQFLALKSFAPVNAPIFLIILEDFKV